MKPSVVQAFVQGARDTVKYGLFLLPIPLVPYLLFDLSSQASQTSRFPAVLGTFIDAALILLVWYIVLLGQRGQTVGWGSLYRNNETIKTHYWKIFTTSLIAGLCEFLLFLLFIIPGVIYSVYWMLASFVTADQGLGARAALSESHRLIKGAWWKTWLVGVGLLVLILVSFVPIFVLPEGLGTSMLGSVLLAVVGIYGQFVHLAWYQTLKARSEQAGSSSVNVTI
jgi:uncharacterized membrane protein